MNKTELVVAIAEKAELSKKDAEKALSAFIEAVSDALANGDKIQLVGFMSYEIVNVPERKCKNPQDGTVVIAPKHKRVKVKIGKSLKEKVN